MKVYLVTGSSSGIGLEISKKILSESEDNVVVGLSRKQNQEIKSLEDSSNKRYIHIFFDLEDTESIKKLMKRIKKIGPIFCFINNAAYAYDDLVTNTDYDTLEKMYKINVLSPIMITKYCIRDMILNKVKGNIIHISSVSTQTGYKGLSMYASTKGALESFSKNVAREWGTLGIRSNVVAPGFVETKMSNKIEKEMKEKIFKRNSLQKEIEIQSISETVYFISSSDARSITGQVIRVDNGTV